MKVFVLYKFEFYTDHFELLGVYSTNDKAIEAKKLWMDWWEVEDDTWLFIKEREIDNEPK